MKRRRKRRIFSQKKSLLLTLLTRPLPKGRPRPALFFARVVEKDGGRDARDAGPAHGQRTRRPVGAKAEQEDVVYGAQHFAHSLFPKPNRTQFENNNRTRLTALTTFCTDRARALAFLSLSLSHSLERFRTRRWTNTSSAVSTSPCSKTQNLRTKSLVRCDSRSNKPPNRNIRAACNRWS